MRTISDLAAEIYGTAHDPKALLMQYVSDLRFGLTLTFLENSIQIHSAKESALLTPDQYTHIAFDEKISELYLKAARIYKCT